MTQDIALKNEHTQISPWRAFADENLAAAIAGDLLKFVKGKWYRGEAKELVPPDAAFLCNMQEIWTGWCKWFGGKVVDHRIGRLIDFPPRLQREDLGDDDDALWETDPAGHRRDPWSPTDRMVMREVGPDNLLTFSTGSVGGRWALAKLCKEFDRNHHQHAGMFPIVSLGRESYEHNVYGEIQKPAFRIVGWDHWDAEAAETPTRLGVTPDDPRTQVQDALDDEIPF